MRRPELCKAAQEGRICCDDLCHGVLETLCGFMPLEYERDNWDPEEEYMETEEPSAAPRGGQREP
jgi:hypothetical protein